jgi:hypothetical protein
MAIATATTITIEAMTEIMATQFKGRVTTWPRARTQWTTAMAAGTVTAGR